MSVLVTLVADVLVATLLVATIVSSVGLSRRIARMKADEPALRQTIGDLVTASASAERAIVGLRATLDECDRTLSERLGSAERMSAGLAQQVEAGQAVIAQIAAIVSNARGGPVEAPRREAPASAMPAQVMPAQVIPPQVIRATRERPVEAAPASPNGERIGAAAAAALAMSERALGRLRSRAA